MPSPLTNELLDALLKGLAMANSASTEAGLAGVPMAPNTPFFRMGEPVRLLATPTSGNTRFPAAGTDFDLPPNVTTFRATNNNPFAIRMRGYPANVAFTPVTPEIGHLFLPGSCEIFTTRYAVAWSVMSIDGPMAAFDPSQKAGTGFLELQYGTGS